MAVLLEQRVETMERFLVIGSGGAGKSTVARELAARLRLPLVHLDTLYWRAGWRPTEAGEWRRVVADLVAQPRWVMDGNYGGTLDLRLARCDCVVFLDLPRAVCLQRVVKRWLTGRGRSRRDVAPGCPERLTWEFVRWVWTYPRRRRPDVLQRLDRLRDDQRAFVLSSAAAVREFLAGLATPESAGQR